jgi:hypothetical protein
MNAEDLGVGEAKRRAESIEWYRWRATKIIRCLEGIQLELKGGGQPSILSPLSRQYRNRRRSDGGAIYLASTTAKEHF